MRCCTSGSDLHLICGSHAVDISSHRDGPEVLPPGDATMMWNRRAAVITTAGGSRLEGVFQGSDGESGTGAGLGTHTLAIAPFLEIWDCGVSLFSCSWVAACMRRADVIGCGPKLRHFGMLTLQSVLYCVDEARYEHHPRCIFGRSSPLYARSELLLTTRGNHTIPYTHVPCNATEMSPVDQRLQLGLRSVPAVSRVCPVVTASQTGSKLRGGFNIINRSLIISFVDDGPKP